jgi:LPXTG-motif cell wall-anchored protein
MGKGFLVRFVAAGVLLFATYNPEGLSYFHWMATDGWAVTPLKAFAGVCLLVGWVFLLRATVLSLGALGTVLAAAFFGTLIWLIVSWAHLEPKTSKGVTYLVLLGLTAVLSTGSVWSLWRRRMTGQVDVEEHRT